MKKKVYREIHEDKLDLNIVIYASAIYEIGGIETWLYYVGKRYNEGQITFVYKNADANQLKRLETVMTCVKYTGQEFHCNKLIYVAPIYVKEDEIYKGAKERYLINHVCYGDAQNQEVFELPKLDGMFAVSDVCKKSCQKRMLGDIVTLYNPIEPDKPKKPLKLVSACRWSKDKGSEQMIEFANRLQHAGISFIWLIFTNEEPEEHHPNMIFMRHRLDLPMFLSEADWGVQFTRLESFGLFPTECLKLGTPVVLTDLEVFREIGIDEKNALFYDWELNGPDVKELLNPPKVKYKAPSSDKLYKELLSWDFSK